MTTTGHQLDVAKIGKGTATNFVGSLLNGFFALATSWTVARFFDTKTLGDYTLGLSIFELVPFFLNAGLRHGVVRYVALHNGEDREDLAYGATASALKLAAVSSLLAGSVLFLVSPLSAALFGKPHLTGFVRILAVSIPFFVISTVFLSATRALQHMKYTVYVRKAFQPGVRLFLTMVSFLAGWHLSGLAFSVAASFVLEATVAWHYFRRVLPSFKFHGKYPSHISTMLSFSLPLSLSALLSFVMFRQDTFILGYFETSASVGIYGTLVQVSIWIPVIQVALNTMVAPIISDLSGEHHYRELQELFQTITRWDLLVSFPLFLSVVLFRDEILNLFGPDFVTASTSLMIVSLGQLILAASGPAELMVVMSGHPTIHLLNNLVLFILGFLFNVFLIPRFGILGAAIANALLWTLLNCVWLAETYFLLGIHPFYRGLLKPVTAGLCSAAIIVVLRNSFLLAPNILYNGFLAVVFAAGYVTFCFAGGIEKEDAILLHSIRARVTQVLKRTLGGYREEPVPGPNGEKS